MNNVSSMRWQKGLPDKEGWYWCNPIDGGKPEIVWVFRPEEEYDLCFSDTEGDIYDMPEEGYRHLWAGPIPEPVPQKKIELRCYKCGNVVGVEFDPDWMPEKTHYIMGDCPDCIEEGNKEYPFDCYDRNGKAL